MRPNSTYRTVVALWVISLLLSAAVLMGAVLQEPGVAYGLVFIALGYFVAMKTVDRPNGPAVVSLVFAIAWAFAQRENLYMRLWAVFFGLLGLLLWFACVKAGEQSLKTKAVAKAS